MLTTYASTIDREDIAGPFALAVDVTFDDLTASENQRVFDFFGENGVDNIYFGQVGTSADLEFVIIVDGVTHRIVAPDAIIEGEFATFRVGVDPDGMMRIAKNSDLLIEAQGAVPADTPRDSRLIGQSADADSTALSGTVINLKIANYGDTDELDPLAGTSPCAVTGETTCLCDKLLPEGEHIDGENSASIIPETDVEGDGEWSPVHSLGLIAIHAMVLPDGKVLAYGTNEDGTQSGQFVYALFDPKTGAHKILQQTTGTDIFCTTLSVDPLTGNIMIMGGDQRGEDGVYNYGVNDVVLFDYKTEEIRTAEFDEMFHARWYGTSVNLPNGEILVVGGKDDLGGGSGTPEVYNPIEGFRELTGAHIETMDGSFARGWWYPQVWVNSSGDVFVTEGGGQNTAYKMTTDGTGTLDILGTLPFEARLQQPGIMFRPDQVAQIGNEGGIWVADISDLSQAPTWTMVAQLDDSRADGGLSMLPDGRVIITGGALDHLRDNQLDNANYDPVIWDPESNSLESLADPELARLYHSSHLLLPDGTIFVAGGGAPGPLVNTNYEIYAPSYLYGADGALVDRPEIVTAPSNVEAGDAFEITVDDTSDLARMTFVKSGGMTHATNADTRFLDLDYTILDEQTVSVSVPQGTVATPGIWMLFALDSNGVPSEAGMVGVDMAEIVETPPIEARDQLLTVYGIDDDPIRGAFEIAVEARFDDLSGGRAQQVFDFGNGPAVGDDQLQIVEGTPLLGYGIGPGADNIRLGQVERSNDMMFTVYRGQTAYSIVAEDAIEEGVMATWIANVDDSGYMRLWRDDTLVAEGQGALPRDIERVSNLVGESNWLNEDSLIGEVRFLEIINAGEDPEYIHLGLPVIEVMAPAAVLEGDEGEQTTLVVTVTLSEPAYSIVTADLTVEGATTDVTTIVIPTGEREASFELTLTGDDVFEYNENITISLDNVQNARQRESAVTVAVTNDDTPPDLAGQLQIGTATAAAEGPDSWQEVVFDTPISNAIVVMGPLSKNDDTPATVRVANVTETGFSWKIDEWDYQDGVHGEETLSWMAMPEGTYTLLDGTVISAGRTVLRNELDGQVDLDGFNAQPVVFSQVTSANDAAAVNTRLSNISDTGFTIELEEEQAADGTHSSERVDYIALETGGQILSAGVTPEVVTHLGYTIAVDSPSEVLFAQMQTRNIGDRANVRYEAGTVEFTFQIDEEQSFDPETNHGPEAVGYLTTPPGTLNIYEHPDHPLGAEMSRPLEEWVTYDQDGTVTGRVIYDGTGDENKNPWATRSDSFEDGKLVQRSEVFDTGTTREVNFTYHSNGVIAGREIIDGEGAQSRSIWSTNELTYNTSGALIQAELQFDDGTASRTRYDPEDLFNWSSDELIFNTSGTASERRWEFDNGSSRTVTFTAEGDLETRLVTDGTGDDNRFIWQARLDGFEDGLLVTRELSYDSGRVRFFTFDYDEDGNRFVADAWDIA